MKELIKGLLEKRVVSAVLVLGRTTYGKVPFPLFIRSLELIEDAEPLAPVMPVSMATQVSKLTRLASPQEPIAVVMKPCELRAVIELVKFRQASLDNLLIISFKCPGVFSIEDYINILDNGKNPVEQAKNKEGIRRACMGCLYPYPYSHFDIGYSYELDGFYPGSEKGKEVLESLGIEVKERDRETEEKEMQERRRFWEGVREKTKQEVYGLDNLMVFLSRCVGCHNCKDLCPICYCKECFWESPVFDYHPDNFFDWGDKKGGVRMPTDIFFYHVGRLTHMSLSCVGCGLCEDACPQDIELQRLFLHVGLNTQAAFEYTPGLSVEDIPPLTTFKEEEIPELG